MVTGVDRVPGWRWLVAGVIAATAGVVLVAALKTTGPAPADEAPSVAQMLLVAPGGEVALSSLPPDHRPLYLAAADDPDVFEQVACYCGCESFLDHRHLLDCFVRPGGGWEAHATGCAVCMAEAADVIELRQERVPVQEIARRIDTRFGLITDPSAA